MSRSQAWNAGEGGTDGPMPAGAELAARLWREHRGWVAAVVRANMPRGADADDLLQELAVKLVEHVDSLDSPERIGPWLRTVATNLARTAGRRHVRTQRIFQPLDERELEANGRDEHVNATASSRGRQALEIAQSLPPTYREPLLMSLRGLSYKQIGLALDLPVTTIETRLCRARAMVREELRQADRREEPRDVETIANAQGMNPEQRYRYGKASAVADEASHE
jgi:RNA polymerase sigma-70 factor, ECF subfamily